jgi:AcrR family transcriptional regulator
MVVARSTLSEQDWMLGALAVIAASGVDALSIEGLARDVGATKGSFYWHFADRSALISAALAHWERVATTEIVERLSAVRDPIARLEALFAESFGQDTASLDSALVSRVDEPLVGPVVRRVTSARLAFLERICRDAGMTPARAARHARLVYAAYVGHGHIRRANPDLARTDRAELRHLLDVLSP